MYKRMSFSKEAKKQYVDLLDEDKPISGQKFTCISFLSPEKVLKQKNQFLFEEFINQWDFTKSFEKFQQFLNFISYKYNLSVDDLMNDITLFMKEEHSSLKKTTIEDDFKNFLDQHEERLETSFNSKYNFQTNVRGIKVRGSFQTQEEAEIKCKMLREGDPNHDVYVGPVGMWMPWEPEAYKTGRVEYLEKELNELMHEKNKNEKEAKVEFDKRIQETKEKAMEDNEKKAEKSGNVLTQTLNENGNLVNVREVNYEDIPDEDVVMDTKEKNNIMSANIQRELFDNDNIKHD
jgi:hypothetical protein